MYVCFCISHGVRLRVFKIPSHRCQTWKLGVADMASPFAASALAIRTRCKYRRLITSQLKCGTDKGHWQGFPEWWALTDQHTIRRTCSVQAHDGAVRQLKPLMQVSLYSLTSLNTTWRMLRRVLWMQSLLLTQSTGAVGQHLPACFHFLN